MAEINYKISRHPIRFQQYYPTQIHSPKINQKMNRALIIRLRSNEGQHRLTLDTGQTYGELLLTISKKLNYPIKSLTVLRDNDKPLSLDQNAKLATVPYFVDGAIIKVQTSEAPKVSHSGLTTADLENELTALRCNHPEGGKCLNCLTIGNSGPKPKEASSSGKPEGRCNHGPTGKCLNCVTVDAKDTKSISKMLCQHGPNAKCVHCLDQEFITDAAHVSFDNWLQQRKLKCKGVHPPDSKCNNCLPPSKVRYQVDKSCRNHEPFPKAMCNKCIPPNVVVQRQVYRHVDYVQFMNVAQIQDLIRYWLPRRHEQQRVAFLYGYYAQDPHYKGGIRVIVEALYQPLQSGTYGDFQIQQQDQSPKLQSVVTGLTLERVGWLFTETNHDVVMSQRHVKMAAGFQEQFRVTHESGYNISNFVTVVLRPDKDNEAEVKPEVYMISDQGQALHRAGLFVDSGSRSKMKVKEKQNHEDAFPSFIVAGKNVTQFQPEFLLVKIAHGSSKNTKFSIIKRFDFPSVSRQKPSKKNLKEYMMRTRGIKNSWQRYSDFNLLLYLAQEIDPTTAHSIAECVAREEAVGENIEEMIDQMADM